MNSFQIFNHSLGLTISNGSSLRSYNCFHPVMLKQPIAHESHKEHIQEYENHLKYPSIFLYLQNLIVYFSLASGGNISTKWYLMQNYLPEQRFRAGICFWVLCLQGKPMAVLKIMKSQAMDIYSLPNLNSLSPFYIKK